MLKRFSRALLIAFLLGLYFAAFSSAGAVPTASNNFELYFGPSQDKSKTIDNFFVALIDSAKTSIDGAFFEFRLQSIVDAFIRAHKRGVKIRLVTDTDYYAGEFTAALVKAGIKVKQDNRSALMHNKFAIVDSNKLWTGSYNLTDTCTFNNNNNALCFYSKELAAIYQREFDEMFVKNSFGITSPSTVEEQKVEISIGGEKSLVEVYFAPEDKPNEKIFELLSQAKKEIYFMHFAFTANEISDMLIDKSKSGIRVSGIFDSKLYRSTGPYSEFFKLTSADSINIVLADNPDGKFHHKVFIVDPTLPDGFVITGSENSSNNGDRTNDENVIVIHNDKVAKAYFTEFKRLFGQFSTAYATCVNLYFKPEQDIEHVSMVFNTNGKPVDKIEIGYPARWPLTGNESVRLLTIDQKPLPKGSIIFNRKGFSAVNLNLKAFGKSSFVVFDFQKMKAPKIKGGYNLYIKSAAKTDDKALPLKSQPGITIADSLVTDESIHSFDQMLLKMQTSYSELLSIQENSTNSEIFEKLFKNWQNNYFEIKEILLTDAKNRNYERIDRFLAIFVNISAEDKKKMPGLTEGLEKILKANAAAGDEEAKSRLKKLK